MAAPHVVVTGVAGQTHLVHVASYLRHLLASTSGPLVVVHPAGERLDLERPELRALLPQDERLQLRQPTGPEAWQAPAGRPITYVAVGVPGLKPWARLRRANPRTALRVVVTDEGLGSYGGWRTRRDAWRREGVPEPWRTVRTTAVQAGSRLLTSQRWALYARGPHGWSVQPEVAQELRRHAAPSGRRSTDVVLLTQPWVAVGVLTPEAARAQVDRLAAQVEGAGGRLVVRPHPHDPVDYAPYPVLAGARPVELDQQVVDAGAVLGGPSTALLNLAAVQGVPAVRVGVPGRPELDRDLGRHQRELLDTFVGAPVPDERVRERLRLA